MALKLGENQIPLLFVGEMGIKCGYAGDDRVYERGGSYFYLEYFSSPEAFIQHGSAEPTTFTE